MDYEILPPVNTLYDLSGAEYEQRMKAWRDRLSELRGAEMKGKMEGKMEGEMKKAYEIARNLKALCIPLEQIAKATGLTIKQIEEL